MGVRYSYKSISLNLGFDYSDVFSVLSSLVSLALFCSGRDVLFDTCDCDSSSVDCETSLAKALKDWFCSDVLAESVVGDAVSPSVGGESVVWAVAVDLDSGDFCAVCCCCCTDTFAICSDNAVTSLTRFKNK